jgi:hypothetical protein
MLGDQYEEQKLKLYVYSMDQIYMRDDMENSFHWYLDGGLYFYSDLSVLFGTILVGGTYFCVFYGSVYQI